MAISHPIVAEIARGVYCINEFGMDSLFLIVGNSRALLIDTGTAAFDLPALIGRLTLLPMDVALTHGHMDHAGGMGWFHRVHLHPADFDLARSITLTMRQDYTRLIRRIAGAFFDVDALNVRDFPASRNCCLWAKGIASTWAAFTWTYTKPRAILPAGFPIWFGNSACLSPATPAIPIPCCSPSCRTAAGPPMPARRD